MANITTVNLTSGVPTGPTGAATVSTIDNLIGAAGVPVASVLSVQGVASMTAVQVAGTVGISGTVPVSGTVSISGTSTITGTVTANQGGAPWTMKPDGTVWTLTGTSANVNVTNASIAVTGTFWQATQPVSGTVTVTQATAANLNATVTGSVSITGTPTISGTVTANQGGAPWTMKPDGTVWTLTGTSANTNITNGSIAITAASLPLPANAATGVGQATTTSGQVGTLVQGAVTTASPAYTTGQTSPLSLDTSGNLRVNVVAGGGSGGTSSSFNATFPATGTAVGGEYLSSPPTLTSGQMVALQTNVSGALKVDGSAVTQPVSGTVTAAQATAANLNATVVGTGTFAVQATQSGTWTVQPGNTANTTPWLTTARIVGNTGSVIDALSSQNVATPPSMIVTGGEFNTSPTTITSGNSSPLQLDASGNLLVNIKTSVTQNVQRVQTAANTGLTQTRVVAAATTNATSLKASAGNIAAIDLFNVAAYMVFLKLYNKASAPTVGTDTPVWTIPIPAGGGFSDDFSQGEYFSTGIAFAITKLQADSDTTVLVAGDVTGRIKWV